MILAICVLFGCIPKSSPYKQSNKNAANYPIKSVPQELLYTNKPISDEHMKELTPILCGAEESREIDLSAFVPNRKPIDDEQDKYEWRYIGTLPYGNHIIYSYLWPANATGKFTQIALVKREGSLLTATPLITGGDKHATMINAESCKLNGNVLTYQQHMTNGLLYQTLLNEFPELSKYLENKNNEKLYWGEADYLGYGTFEAILTPDGKLKKNVLKSFTLASDDKDLVGENKSPSWKQHTQKASLSMGIALNEALSFHSSKNNDSTLKIAQLKEIMIEASAYAKYKY